MDTNYAGKQSLSTLLQITNYGTYVYFTWWAEKDPSNLTIQKKMIDLIHQTTEAQVSLTLCTKFAVK